MVKTRESLNTRAETMITQNQCRMYCAGELESLGYTLYDQKDSVMEAGEIMAYIDPPMEVQDVLDKWGMHLVDQYGWLPLVHVPSTL